MDATLNTVDWLLTAAGIGVTLVIALAVGYWTLLEWRERLGPHRSDPPS